MKPIIIIGTGGHSKVVLDVLLKKGLKVLGFVSLDKKAGSFFCDYKILGGDKVIDSYKPSEISLVNAVGVIARDKRRWDISKKFRAKGFSVLSIIDPSAIIALDATLDEGVHVMAGAIIQPGAAIGLDTIINSGAIIEHDCIIEESCHIAPGVTLSGNVRIGKESFIGVGSSIIHNISIGNNCTIAAGSVVFKDINNGDTFIQAK